MWVMALNFLIVMAAVSHLFINLSLNFYHMQKLLSSLMFVLENSVKYVFFIVFFRVVKYIIEENKESFGVVSKIFKEIYPFMYYLYLAVFIAFAWLIVIVKLNYSNFIGILSVLIVVTVFVIARAYVFPMFSRSPDIYRTSYKGLNEALQTIFILSAVLAFYIISLKYFGLEQVVNYFSRKHLIITDFVEISYFSLIQDAFLFLVLISLIGLLKNLWTFYETGKALHRLRRSG